MSWLCILRLLILFFCVSFERFEVVEQLAKILIQTYKVPPLLAIEHNNITRVRFEHRVQSIGILDTDNNCCVRMSICCYQVSKD